MFSRLATWLTIQTCFLESAMLRSTFAKPNTLGISICVIVLCIIVCITSLSYTLSSQMDIQIFELVFLLRK